MFLAFSAGLLLASLLNTETDNAFEGGVQIVALLAFGYSVAHLIVTNVIVAGRAKRGIMGTQSERDGADEWEDAVVHPDEAPPPR